LDGGALVLASQGILDGDVNLRRENVQLLSWLYFHVIANLYDTTLSLYLCNRHFKQQFLFFVLPHSVPLYIACKMLFLLTNVLDLFRSVLGLKEIN